MKATGAASSNLIIVIGRGNSGTRMISYTLYASGVFMGQSLNPSGDMMPPYKMYDACKTFSRHVRMTGDLKWNFAELSNMGMDRSFVDDCLEYLSPVLSRQPSFAGEMRGWKLPETTLVFPWVAKLFPDAKYIYVVRDPRTAAATPHKTDDLRDWGIPCPTPADSYHQRAISWYYQHELVMNTPRPSHFMQIRFEDFVLRQEDTIKEMEAFLNIPLARIPVRKAPLQRKVKGKTLDFPFLSTHIRALGYD